MKNNDGLLGFCGKWFWRIIFGLFFYSLFYHTKKALFGDPDKKIVDEWFAEIDEKLENGTFKVHTKEELQEMMEL